MYYYIVDPQKISQREFERVQNLLYSSLSEYRISGEVVRVTGLRTVNQLVENAFSHGAKTIVAVGSDDTLHDLINAVKDREMIVGFIPIFDTEIGKILGLKDIAQAAKTIGVRRIEELDLGSVNGNYFLSRLTFGLGAETGKTSIFNLKLLQSLFNLPTFEVKFSADNQFQASVKTTGGMIVNCGNDQRSSDPTDGIADIMLLSKLSKLKTIKYRAEIMSGSYKNIPQASVVHVNRLEISSPAGMALRVGNRVIAKTPATIEILPKAIKIIVGKDRRF